MKHRNKRIGLELYPIDTHKIFGTKWFKQSNKYSRKAKGTKRVKMEEMGTIPAKLNRL
jgi:hypothetical protein